MCDVMSVCGKIGRKIYRINFVVAPNECVLTSWLIDGAIKTLEATLGLELLAFHNMLNYEYDDVNYETIVTSLIEWELEVFMA